MLFMCSCTLVCLSLGYYQTSWTVVMFLFERTFLIGLCINLDLFSFFQNPLKNGSRTVSLSLSYIPKTVCDLNVSWSYYYFVCIKCDFYKIVILIFFSNGKLIKCPPTKHFWKFSNLLYFNHFYTSTLLDIFVKSKKMLILRFYRTDFTKTPNKSTE